MSNGACKDSHYIPGIGLAVYFESFGRAICGVVRLLRTHHHGAGYHRYANLQREMVQIHKISRRLPIQIFTVHIRYVPSTLPASFEFPHFAVPGLFRGKDSGLFFGDPLHLLQVRRLEVAGHGDEQNYEVTVRSGPQRIDRNLWQVGAPPGDHGIRRLTPWAEETERIAMAGDEVGELEEGHELPTHGVDKGWADDGNGTVGIVDNGEHQRLPYCEIHALHETAHVEGLTVLLPEAVFLVLDGVERHPQCADEVRALILVHFGVGHDAGVDLDRGRLVRRKVQWELFWRGGGDDVLSEVEFRSRKEILAGCVVCSGQHMFLIRIGVVGLPGDGASMASRRYSRRLMTMYRELSRFEASCMILPLRADTVFPISASMWGVT